MKFKQGRRTEYSRRFVDPVGLDEKGPQAN